MEELSLRFQILDESVTIETVALPAQARLDELLPALRILDDGAMGVVTRKIGRPVTCAKGCSACCRIQLVPVTPAEAYALFRLVEELPEPRRSEIRARFADRVARLEQGGLADFFRHNDPLSTDEPMRSNMTRYLELGLACPFLEEDVCGIYESRPFACREYLVTTPKEFCTQPMAGSVEVLPRILLVGRAAIDAATALSGVRQLMLPLIFALEYAETHREELERKYASGPALSDSIARAFVAAYQSGSLVPQSP